jgi:ABC-2 type transport system permease protein
MSKIGLVIGREYSSRVKKRSFLIMTLLGPLIFAGLMAIAVFVTQADQTEHTILVVDTPGLITHVDPRYEQLVPNCPECFPEKKGFTWRFAEETIPDEAFIESDYTVMIELYDDLYLHKNVNLYYKKVPSISATSHMESCLEGAVERARVLSEGLIDFENYKRLKIDLLVNKINIAKGDTYEQERAGVGMGFSVIIFFFIFLFGAYVMRGVMEEKSNRIVEVIVSSIKPFQLMMGKIIGIGLVAITQLLIWVVFSLIIFFVVAALFEAGSLQNAMATAEVQQGANMDFESFLAQQDGFKLLLEINWVLMLSMFTLYFIGGYVMYSGLFAAIGAAVDDENDVQQFMTPVMLPLFFSYFVAILSVNNPEGFAAQLFSFIPLTSPTVMMVRVAIGGVSIGELVLSLALLAAACFGMIWIAAKIYRTGILMYGKRPSYKELWKWMKYRS